MALRRKKYYEDFNKNSLKHIQLPLFPQNFGGYIKKNELMRKRNVHIKQQNERKINIIIYSIPPLFFLSKQATGEIYYD